VTTSTVMSPDRIALVTGATSGIGKAVVETFIERGLKVICIGRRQDALEDLCGPHGQRACGLVLDVADPAFAENLANDLPDAFREIDILVASAGSDVGGRVPFGEGKMNDWRSTIETNVIGLMATCHAIVPGMLERKRGHIVTLGSVSGLFTYPGGAAYSASKYAVRAFTESLRKDYAGEPLRITEILPGLVKTGFAEARHRGDASKAEDFYEDAPAYLKPEDVAGSVVYALGTPDHVNIDQIVITPV